MNEAPPKGIRVRCTECGLISSPLIVKKLRDGAADATPLGRCINEAACQKRQAKESKR